MRYKLDLSARFAMNTKKVIVSSTQQQKKFLRRRKASTLVETALCMTFVLIPLTIGGLQFAIIINATHTLDRLAREGARFTAVHGGEVTFDGVVTQGDTAGQPQSLKNYMKKLCVGSSIPWTEIQNKITVTPAANRVSGSAVTVTITYPMGNKIIFKPANITATSSLFFLKPFLDDRVVSATFVKE